MSANLYECLDLSEWKSDGNPRVDRAKGVIRNVKALGWKSLNGREYLPEGVNVAHYEGRIVYADHGKTGQARSVKDAIGVLEGAEKTADGIYAQRLRLFNPAGEFEQRVLTAAEVAPHVFGLSHTAKGKTRRGASGEVVEQIESVQSVDLVGDPATVKGFFESRSQTLTIEALAEQLKDTRPDYAKALQELAASGTMTPGYQMPQPAGMPGANGQSDYVMALKDAMKACIDDDSLSDDDLIRKIRGIRKLINGKKAGAPDMDQQATRESQERDQELAQLRAEKRLRKAAKEAGVELSETLLESVRTDLTDEQAKALVLELKESATRRREPQTPRSAGAPAPKVDDKPKDKLIPESREERAKWLNGR